MDFDQIKKIAGSLSKLIDDNEKISLHLFAKKLSKASSEYPEDQTIGVMANITARMADSNKLFITKAEVRNLYNKLYSRNTKFAELFSSELGENSTKLADKKVYDRTNDDESLSIIQESYEKVVDPILSNALNSAFGNVVVGYSKNFADKAKSVVERECSTIKLASKVDVISGNEDFIICVAAFETPRGKTSVYIPVEIVAAKVLLPTMFIGNNGQEDLSKTNLEKYIVCNAGNKLNISEKVIFNVIKTAKDNNTSKISAVDLALTKLNAEKESAADFSMGQVLFQKVAAEDENLVVKTPKYIDNEIETFTASFSSAKGVASFTFGKDVVEFGRKVLANKLNSFGFKNSQIAVFSTDESAITYAVSINNGRVAFRVPVKIENNKVLEPVVLISNGSLNSFSVDGINALLTSESIEYKTAAVASAVYGLKASELVELVRVAVKDNNYAKAEDALNVLSESGDDKAYQIAFSAYSNGLSGKISKSVEAKCNMVVKNASSKHELCGHTGLPLHKVYQDKNGDCHPLYRKGMEDSNEGAYFLNSKIFF